MSKSMFITREFIKLNPHVLFVFGDNDARRGLGGMAKEFRGEPNAIGIRTKKFPSMNDSAFYTDKEVSDNTGKINEDILEIYRRMKTKQYTILYIPEGIGEGLALLKVHAPGTYDHLTQALELLKEEYT